MTMIEVIERIIKSDILLTSLTHIPKSGASSEEIKAEESLLNRKFSEDLKRFLMKWNGIDLEILRIYRCGKSTDRLKRFADEQFAESSSAGFIAIGSSPAGFIYLENEKSEIFSFDTDGGDIEFLAENLEVFLTELVFGKRADEFMGEEWKENLRSRFFFE